MTEMELVFEYSWRMVLLLCGRSGIEMWMDFRNCKDDGKLRWRTSEVWKAKGGKLEF